MTNVCNITTLMNIATTLDGYSNCLGVQWLMDILRFLSLPVLLLLLLYVAQILIFNQDTKKLSNFLAHFLLLYCIILHCFSVLDLILRAHLFYYYYFLIFIPCNFFL